MDAEEVLHWLALVLVPGLGPRKGAELVNRRRGVRGVFRSSRSELEAEGVSGTVAQTIASGCTFELAVEQQRHIAAAEAEAITLSDQRYPSLLREIFDPPLILFCRGRIELLDTVMLGVVGTRRPTAYGTMASERLSADLAKAGLTIASGMARGVDTAAHRGALGAHGNTLAVFGCGLDHIYPSENRNLAVEIGQKGLLVTEFPMGTPAYPQNFPIRNRIISGLSSGVLIVEGAEYSGSAITAKLALDQGREVFAVPGNITSKMSWAPNLLIKQGAKLVQEWNDVVVELPPEQRRRLSAERRNQLNLLEEAGPDLNDAARRVLRALKLDQPVQLDVLMEAGRPESLDTLSSSEIIAALFDLELQGLVRQLPGKQFIRVWAES